MGVFFYGTTRQCNPTGERNSEKDCPSPRRDRDQHTQGRQQMSVILKNQGPTFQEVAKLGGKPAQVYAVLWASASMDQRLDPNLHLEWEDRRDCGGTSEWTVSGLAKHLGACKKSVSKALCVLLDQGFIQVQGYARSKTGTKHTVWRVTVPSQLEAVRHSIGLMGSPSERWKARIKQRRWLYNGEIWDTTGDPITFQEGFDPNYHGLYAKDHTRKVTHRVAYYNQTTPRFSQSVVIA